MTKPTGRPKGRPKTREYVTLMARVPLELVEQARKYAARKQQPISEVLRDGLQLLLEQEDTAPHYVYDRNTPPVKVSDTKEDISPRETPPVKVSDTKEALLPLDTQQPVKVSDTKEAPLPLDTLQPVIVSNMKEDSLPLQTQQPVKVSDMKEGSLPRKTPPVKMSDTKAADALPSFDTSKFYLGKLCPQGHNFHGTGQSLLRKHKQSCRECENSSKREKRAREKAQRQ